MEGSKEMFLRMREDEYKKLDPRIRDKFTYAEVREFNEYETHKNDPVYTKFYKAVKKAKEDLQDYLFKKRHNMPF